MLPNATKRTSTFSPFKLLVGHAPSQDYSKGIKLPPLRHGFQAQLIATNKGSSQLGTYTLERSAIKLQVMSGDYGNNLLAPPQPRRLDELQIYSDGINDMELIPPLKVGEVFGRTDGEGAVADLGDLASDLCDALNDRDLNLIATIDPDDNTRIIVQSQSLFDTLVVEITQYSYLVLGGQAPLQILDIDNNVLYNPTALEKLGKKLVIREKAILPIQELTEEPIITEFSQFVKNTLKLIPVFVHTNTFTAISIVDFVSGGVTYRLTYSPKTKNNISYNLVDGVYVKNVVLVDNFTITNRTTLAENGARFEGSLEKNKQGIIDFVNILP